MLKLSFRVILVVTSLISVCSVVFAQKSAEQYVISAKAGAVNQTEGAVNVVRVSGRSEILVKGDQLEIGDRVSTGADGRVEILLNPGSYVRLGANSEFKFKTTALDDLQIKLEHGSAMFEVFATDEFTVSIVTPKGKARLIESGVYRVNVEADGTGVIAVTEGRAEVGYVNPTSIKKGRTGSIVGDSVTVAKFERGKRDELAEWSRTRAKDLAKLTSNLKNKDIRDSLISSFQMGRWGMYDSFGLWLYFPVGRTFCFLPFGMDWYSPYGYGFGMGIDWFSLPPYVRWRRIQSDPNSPNGSVQTFKGEGRQNDPPFTKVDGQRDPVRPIGPEPRQTDFPTPVLPVDTRPQQPPSPPVDSTPRSPGTKKPGDN